MGFERRSVCARDDLWPALLGCASAGVSFCAAVTMFINYQLKRTQAGAGLEHKQKWPALVSKSRQQTRPQM